LSEVYGLGRMGVLRGLGRFRRDPVSGVLRRLDKVRDLWDKRRVRGATGC
jgi:hypothetical protein